MNVGFQGEPGAHSEAALVAHFGKDVKPIGFETFDEVYEAMHQGKLDAAVLPFENTITGSIVQNYDLLLKYEFSIVAELMLTVNHHLLVNKGANVGDITHVYSHPQALDQCKSFIKQHNFVASSCHDTAGGAKLIKESATKEHAAIASRFCAEMYGLDIAQEYIADVKNNITKFFVLVPSTDVNSDIKKEKTSIAFKTKHFPGSLINCIQRFHKNDVNLTKLESRPIPENPFEYIFYVDFEGGTNDDHVKLALSEAQATAEFFKVLGSYPKGKAV